MAWTCDVSIEDKVRQDCYNRGYEQGRKNPAEEFWAGVEKLQKQVKEYQDKIEQGTLVDISTIANLLNEWFECPCNFTLNEEDVAMYMYEKYGDWCEKNCDKNTEDSTPCWEMYLKAKLKEITEGKV